MAQRPLTLTEELEKLNADVANQAKADTEFGARAERRKWSHKILGKSVEANEVPAGRMCQQEKNNWVTKNYRKLSIYI